MDADFLNLIFHVKFGQKTAVVNRNTGFMGPVCHKDF